MNTITVDLKPKTHNSSSLKTNRSKKTALQKYHRDNTLQ